jgi:peptidyl-tRNA hydrolase, PTH1 family
MADAHSSGGPSHAPWLLVGLGNPGREYAHNRHNVGFMAVERWLDRQLPAGAGSPWREKFHARIATVSLPWPKGPEGSAVRVVVLEPQTYMNRSGRSVVPAMQFYRVPPERLVVVHDELDFEVSRLAVKKGGGHGGHNGLRDIMAQLGHGDFIRVRMGIGRPLRGGDVSRWVLQDFDAVDAATLPERLDRACHAITAVLTQGVAAAMNDINTKG